MVLECRKCKGPVGEERAIYLDVRQARTVHPVCPRCYEDSLRRSFRPGVVTHGRRVGDGQKEYDGDFCPV